jgi:hypothetical protein
MKEFKGTKDVIEKVVVNGDYFISVENEGKCIGRLYIDEYTPIQETEKNANLIIDAFNVRQQINCELSELLEQRNEMLAMLEEAKSELCFCIAKLNQLNEEVDFQTPFEIDQLIKKVKDNE